MGIYISGVKGLPEQVQENKNKIKEVEEQIEGIDFEAVRQLQGQVAENTQDINNLEASIGVQNQTINALGDRTTALERKTQLMSYNDDYSKTDFRNSIEVADDVIANGVHVSGDGTIVNSKGSGLHFQEGSDDTTLTIANNDGAVYHALQLHGDGTLTLDGNPVGAKDYYVHRILLLIDGSNTSIEIFNSSSTPFTSTTLYQYLYDKNCRTKANPYWINQVRTSDGTTIKFLNGVYASDNNIKASLFKFSGSVSEQLNASFNGDNVFPM